MTSTQWTNVSDIQSGVLSYYGLGDSAPWSYGTLGNDSSGVGRAGAHFGLQYGFVVFLYDGSSTELAVPVNMFYGRNNTSGTWRPATLYPADGQPVELRHAWHGTNGTQTTNPGYLRDTSETLSWVPFVSGQTDWPALGHSNKQTYLSNTMYYKQSAISFTSTSPYLKTDTISWYMQYNGSNGNLTFAHGDGTSNTSNGVPTIRILNYKALIDAVNSATIKNYLANVNLYREGGLTDIMATLDTATAFDPNKPFENVTASGIDAAINSAVSTISGVVTGLNVTPEQDAYAGLRAAISKARATYFADTTLALGYGGNNPLAADGINKVYCSKPYEEFAKLYKEIADYGPNSNRNANAFMRVAGFTGNYTQGKQANTYATQLEAKLDAVKNHTKGSTNMYKVPDDSTHRKATCTVDGVGVEYSTCPNCYEEYISNNAYPIASGHTTVFTSAESLSCTTGGKPAYWHCERSESDLVAAGCGKYFADNNGVAGTEINGIPDELPALGHIFGDTPAQTKQDATCLHGSYKEIWKCDRCGLDFLDNDEFNAAPASANDLGEQNDKKEHAFREHEPVENSCHQAGNEHYWSCDTCDTFFHSASATDIWDVEQEGSPILPQLAHSFGEYTYDEDSQKDDKCVTPGTMTATCENCGDKDTILDPANPAIGHKFKADNAKHEREMPTCYDEGKILYYTCDNCGNNYATDSPDSVVPLESYQLVIPAIGVHTLIEHGAREATCQQKGYETYYECSVCLGKFKSNDQTAGIEAFEDNKIANFDGEGDNAWAKDGTHRIITMGGEPATCITAREASHYECVWCSTWFDSDDADTAKEIPEEQPEAAIDPDNHINLWIIHTEHTASCTEEGWSETVYECQGCGEFYKNHDGSANTASATKLTEEALKEIRSETVPHNELGTRETTQEITPATCTTVGYENVTVYCTACDQNQKVEAREIPKTDHKFGDAVNEKAATCLNPGVPVTYYTCSSCNLNYTDNAPKTEKVYSGDVVTPATGHSFELGEKGVPGTCEKDGTNTYYVCTNANCELGKNAKFLDPNDTTATRGATEEELTDVSPKNHTKLSYKPAVAADCSTWQAGKIAHIYCDGCKNYYTTYDHWGEEPIDPDDEALTIKPSHKLTHYSQDSSCLDYGWKDVYVCDDCGAAFTSETPNVKDGLTDEEIESDIIIPAPGHSFGDYIATDATCIVAGEVGHYECSECKIAVKCDEADATKEEVLFYAGDDSNDLSTPATGHEFGAVIAEDPATCTGEGTAAHYECANCDIVIKDFDGINLDSFKYEENGYDIVITELGHEEADPIQMDIVPSSCTAEGSYTKVVRCVRYDACGYVFSRVENQILAKADHVAAYQKVTAQTAGDCQTNGTITVGTVCANCNSVYNTFTLETDKGDHKYDDGEVTKKPTCVDKGETTYTCSVCGNSYSEKNIPETGIHDYYAEVTKEPTCAENGVTTYTCSVCGDSYSEENITATGKHEYDMGVVTKEPTCAEYGETTYTCVVCGDTYTVADALPTGEHNYDGVVTKDATCTEWGETTYTCTVCG
ncbi:MAG: hypothetical protein J1E05_05785, partial [Eubacterium sp.]|nr:hypothetical protein [Eubacterium sp.]